MSFGLNHTLIDDFSLIIEDSMSLEQSFIRVIGLLFYLLLLLLLFAKCLII
jgi:hypothetical protein